MWSTNDLIFTSGIILGTSWVVNWIRNTIKITTSEKDENGNSDKNKKSSSSNINRLCLEFLTSFEAAVFAFHTNHILWEHYPLWLMVGAVFLFSLYQTMSLTPLGIDGNPTCTFLSWLHNKINLAKGVGLILIQTLGALTSYFLIIQPLWSHQPVWTGHLLFDSINQAVWPSAVIKDNPSLSALAESVVTCIVHLVTVTVGGVSAVAALDATSTQKLTIGVTLINTLISVLGAPWCGAFYNSAIATVVELSLSSSTHVPLISKIWVYWISPFFGVNLAQWILNRVGFGYSQDEIEYQSIIKNE